MSLFAKLAPRVGLGAVVGAALIAVGGRLVWPLPGAQAPLSLQTFALLAVAFALGPLGGTLAVGLYLAAAAAGLPVLANGASGVEVLVGSHGGYFVGFLLAPGLAVLLAGGAGPGLGRALRVGVGAAAAHGAILVAGVTWLVAVRGVATQPAIDAALLPFLLAGLLKSAGLAVWVPVSERLGLGLPARR